MKTSIARNWAILVVILALLAVVVSAIYALTKDQSASRVNTPVNTNLGLNENTNGGTDVNGNQNQNAVSNINTGIGTNNNVNAVVNTSLPVNTNSATNTNSVPSGWITYNSQNSEYSVNQRLQPGFTVSYPGTWKVHEDIGGVYLAEEGIANLEPQINITRSEQITSKNTMTSCSDRLRVLVGSSAVFEVKKTIVVDGSNATYITYLQPETVQTHPSGRDGIFVCVPRATFSDVLWARPQSSTLVRDFFDAVLQTYRLQS